MFRNRYWTWTHAYNQTRIRIRAVGCSVTADRKRAVSHKELQAFHLFLFSSHFCLNLFSTLEGSFPRCKDQLLFSFLVCEQAPAERVWRRLQGPRRDWMRVKWPTGKSGGGWGASPLLSFIHSLPTFSSPPLPPPPPSSTRVPAQASYFLLEVKCLIR